MEEALNTEKAYSLGGTEVTLDNPKAYAREAETSHGIKRYFVKQGVDGMLYNPWGLYSQFQRTSSYGRKTTDWRQVSQKVFSFYMNFLRTQNAAHLTNAERELINGI